MLNEEQKNALIDRLIRRQEKANVKILKEIGKALGETGNLIPSQAYTIGQQIKYGESLQNILNVLSETSEMNKRDIYNILRTVSKGQLNYSKKYFKANGINFLPFEKNTKLLNKVDEVAIATTNMYRNIAKTTGLTFLNSNGLEVTKGVQEAYYEIIDDAIQNVATGKTSFYQSLENQLKVLGGNGIQSIEYESGISRRIDTALRMNMSDGLNDLAIAQQKLVGNQFNNDGWEISVHDKPAPDHAPVQGHIFSNEEFNKMQDYSYLGSFKDIKGNKFYKGGFFRAIGDLNCKHFAYAVVIGASKPLYSDDQLKQINENNEKGFTYENKHYTLYEATQTQRRLETEIRKEREHNVLLKATQRNLEDKNQLITGIQKSDLRIDQLLNKYHDFSNKAGLKTQLERIRVI